LYTQEHLWYTFSRATTCRGPSLGCEAWAQGGGWAVKNLRLLAAASQIIWGVIGSIIVSLILGIWIDRTFGTTPWGVLLLMLLGVAAALYSTYRGTKALMDRAAAENPPVAHRSPRQRGYDDDDDDDDD
jgi:F0F1-type ATP synthase assembly protein I